MSALIALDGRDVIAAFVKGGFRIARRERGLALLVRGVQVVVVPEAGLLSAAKLHGLLDRAEVGEKEMLSWLARTGASSRSNSGFHQKTPIPSEPPPKGMDVDDAVKNATHALSRADAFQKSLARWREALQEVDEREKREVRARKR